MLARYLKGSDRYLRHAVHPSRQPGRGKLLFNAPFCRIGNRLDGLDKPGHCQHLRKNHHDQGGFLGISRFRNGVPDKEKNSGYASVRRRLVETTRILRSV
tara:strand:+ start:191 stop:490 length:300 start_codon:yes stop_codon:yes gene_type:complete